jgi:hypothetical protein
MDLKIDQIASEETLSAILSVLRHSCQADVQGPANIMTLWRTSVNSEAAGHTDVFEIPASSRGF